MIKVIITDFSRVLLFPTNANYRGGLNALNNKLLKSDPNYNFTEHFKLNKDLIDYYGGLDLPVYIFTSETIQEHASLNEELHKVFSGIFSAKYLGVNKTDKDAYISLASELGVQIGEILYIDDNHENIEAAREAGCDAVLYTSNEDVYTKYKSK